jgi:hypothetical protein
MRSEGTITVKTFGENSERKAIADLKKQLRDMAHQNGVRLVGRPDVSTSEPLLGFWNGSASQGYRRA